jgi:hypothetical protein
MGRRSAAHPGRAARHAAAHRAFERRGGGVHAEHFGAEIPIAGIAGDQQAALAGQACFRAGLSKNTYGTGCFALMHTGGRLPVSRHRLLGTRAASTSGVPQFAIEGSVFVAGAAVQWLRDKLGLIQTAAESEALAASTPDTGGVYLVPAFVGLGAPHWDAGARGIVCGLTRSSDRAHIVRATLESIAYQTRELIDAMQADAGERISELRVDGGAAANNFLMQFQADILDCPIVRPADIETTAYLGAAYLAGLATGFWKSVAEVESFWRAERRFEPAMDAGTRDRLFSGWKDAVARCRVADRLRERGESAAGARDGPPEGDWSAHRTGRGTRADRAVVAYRETCCWPRFPERPAWPSASGCWICSCTSALLNCCAGRRVRINAPAVLFAVAMALLTSLIFGAGVERLAASAGAGLVLCSYARLWQTNPGFAPDHLLTARISLPPLQYSDPARITAFYSGLLAGVRALPGVVSAGAVEGLPFGAGGHGGDFKLAGRPWPASAVEPDVQNRTRYARVLPGRWGFH